MQVDVEHTLTSLEPNTQYLARVQTGNEFGPSRWSQDFKFNTLPGNRADTSFTHRYHDNSTDGKTNNKYKLEEKRLNRLKKYFLPLRNKFLKFYHNFIFLRSRTGSLNVVC